jgi:hypothetical protein
MLKFYCGDCRLFVGKYEYTDGKLLKTLVSGEREDDGDRSKTAIFWKSPVGVVFRVFFVLSMILFSWVACLFKRTKLVSTLNFSFNITSDRT